MSPKHFLDLADFDGATLKSILEDAKARKKARAGLPKGALMRTSLWMVASLR